MLPDLSGDHRDSVAAIAVDALNGIQNEEQRAQATQALTPYLTESAVRDALAAASTLTERHWRAEVQVHLGARLAEFSNVDEALELARSITEDWQKTTLISKVAVWLAKTGQPRRAVDLIEAHASYTGASETLSLVAPYLDDALLRQVLHTMLTRRWHALMGGPVEGLAVLARHLPTDLLRDALTNSRTIGDQTERNDIVRRIARCYSGHRDEERTGGWTWPTAEECAVWAARLDELGYAAAAETTRSAAAERTSPSSVPIRTFEPSPLSFDRVRRRLQAVVEGLVADTLVRLDELSDQRARVDAVLMAAARITACQEVVGGDPARQPWASHWIA